MKIFLKKEIYFEVEIDDGTDRALVSHAMEEIIDPAFEELVRKIKFSKDEIKKIDHNIGRKVQIQVIPKSDFIARLNVK